MPTINDLVVAALLSDSVKTLLAQTARDIKGIRNTCGEKCATCFIGGYIEADSCNVENIIAVVGDERTGMLNFFSSEEARHIINSIDAVYDALIGTR